MIEIIGSYALFALLWFILFNTILSDGSAGSFGLSLLPLAPIGVPLVLIFVEIREAIRDIRG